MVALLIATRRIAAEFRPWDWLDTTILIAAIGLALHFGRQIAREMPRQRQLKQAIRAEHATAQEPAASLAGDNRIIHDVQAKEFNIDHVVITPAGVFAVKTKSRLKPPVGNGASAVKVKYDGRQLEFPGWSETKPHEYIAEGITDGISSALAKAPGLRVIDRNSTYYFKNIATDTVSAGRGLNVEGIVTGHIEQQSGALSVTVEIVDVTSNNKVWQQQFRLPQGEVLVVQQEIVRNIAQNLHRDAASGPDLTEPPTSDPEAYDLYIRGRYHWSKRANTDILRSAEVFQAAIAKDPDFAKAYMGVPAARASPTP